MRWLALALLLPATAGAAVVDTLADEAGDCAVAGRCTLRAAIATGEPVAFGVAGTIDLGSPLPLATAELDGGGTITLDGAAAGRACGVTTTSTVRGLALRGFDVAGVCLLGDGLVSGNVVEDSGAGIALLGAAGRVEDNRLERNRGAGVTGAAGTARISGNTIVGNAGAGVAGTTGAVIRGNAIDDNGGPAIDLDGEPYPGLASVTSDGEGTLLVGEATGGTLDVYTSPACDPSGRGEARLLVGSIPVEAGRFAVRLPVALEGVVTVTTTGAAGTSELSACVTARTCEPSPILATLPPAHAGVPYAGHLAGGVLELAGGALPEGLALAPDGTIAGTPLGAGTSRFTVTAERDGCVSAATLQIDVDCPEISLEASLPAGVAGTAYQATLAASGGTAPYDLTIAGALPEGVTLRDGVLAGVPTERGDFPLTLTASDAGRCAASTDVTLTIACPAIAIAPEALPAASLDEPYGFTFLATGGVAPYRFGGAVPEGLTLDEGGFLSGTPVEAGDARVTLAVVDEAGCTGAAALDLRVCPRITLTPTELPPAYVGVPYRVALEPAGGASPYALVAGPLPAGLAVVGSAIEGTPTEDGRFTVRVDVTDGESCRGAQAYILAVTCDDCGDGPPTLDEPGDGGCAVGGSARGAPWWLLALLVLCRRRR